MTHTATLSFSNHQIGSSVMIPRTLEPEIMDSPAEAIDYDSMDHTEVNRVFVDDCLKTCKSFRLTNENGSVQNDLYENWRSDEPNDAGDGEDGIEMRSTGGWNDFFNSSTNGCYFVEYPGVVRAVPMAPAAMILTVLLLGALGIRRLAKHA